MSTCLSRPVADDATRAQIELKPSEMADKSGVLDKSEGSGGSL